MPRIPGAGRKLGSKDKAPRQTAARKQALAAAVGGSTPLEVMLRAMHKYETLSEDETLSDIDRDEALNRAHVCAKDAAPYLHAKLANTTINASIRRTVQDCTDEELFALAGEDEGEEGAESEG